MMEAMGKCRLTRKLIEPTNATNRGVTVGKVALGLNVAYSIRSPLHPKIDVFCLHFHVPDAVRHRVKTHLLQDRAAA